MKNIMKNFFYLTMLFCLFFSCSQTEESEIMAQHEMKAETRGMLTQNVVIQWDEEGQELDGFGIACLLYTSPSTRDCS